MIFILTNFIEVLCLISLFSLLLFLFSVLYDSLLLHSFYLSSFLSLSFSFSLSLSLYLTLSLSASLSLCLTLSLSPSLSIPHSLSPSPSLFFLLQIKLKCLKSELQRRPVYYYPTIEQCQEKLKQLDARQTLLEKKESKYRKEKIIRKSKLFFSDVFLIFVILIDLPNNYERV